jgi:hypothetical protein
MGAAEKDDVTDLFEPISCDGWTGLLEKLRTHGMVDTSDSPWIFRGQAARFPKLLPLFERCWNRLPAKTAERWMRKKQPRIEWQDEMLRDFQRRCGHLVPNAPAPDDRLEWLAVMQHHGAPTQLLDWTYSPYVAAHTAVKDTDGPLAGDAWVWAIDARWLAKRVERLLRRNPRRNPSHKTLNAFLEKRSGALFARLFRPKVRAKFVYPINPHRLHERLTIQQGVFLCQGDLEASFAENLRATVAQAKDARDHMKRFVISGDHWSVLHELRRMNVTEASLFPGIDGFARDYRYRLFPPPE